MKMTRTAGWSLGTTGLCVALVAGSWLGLVEPERAAAAESREMTVAAEARNAALEVEIEQLRQQFADLPSRQAELAAIRLALPEEPGLSQLIRDVTTRSTEAGTTVESITTAAPVAVIDTTPVAVVAPTEAAGAAEGEPAAAPSTEPSAVPSAPTDTPPAPVPGAAGAPVPPGQPVLAAIPVVITAKGDFSRSTLFLKNVQADMPRALIVDSLVLSVVENEDDPEGTVQTVITGRVFAFVDPTTIPEVPVPTVPSSDG